MTDSAFRTTLTTTFLLLATTGAAQQNPHQFNEWKETAKPRLPAVSCRDLRALTNYNFSIDSAMLVPAADGTVEFCQVRGQILPEVQFEVSFPAKWNGRLYMSGNGGFAGESLDAQGRRRTRDKTVSAGFAFAATNTGHDAAREPQASFALNPQKLIDYAFRAVHVTVVTAKEIARTYYGSGVERSYFDGCSTGGRQGLISAQRFPADFDGIIVGAPVLDLTGTMMHYAQMNRALQDAPGLADKMPVLASTIYGKCDAADGLADGVLSDPRQCRFDPVADLPSCAGDTNAKDCFTAPEIAALRAVYSPVMASGATLYPGLPVGAEIAASGTEGTAVSGWQGWIVNTTRRTFTLGFVEAFFKHMVTPGREIDWRGFDPAKDVPQLRKISALLDATDTDLRAFRARGGKILMYFGWAEPALNPLRGIQYFEDVQKTTGPSADFFRLFMLPGVFHCVGGPGPDLLDTITPLVEWVERGTPPARLTAVKRQGTTVTRTRPVCPYPQVAVYQGSGSTDEAASFECRAPVK